MPFSASPHHFRRGIQKSWFREAPEIISISYANTFIQLETGSSDERKQRKFSFSGFFQDFQPHFEWIKPSLAVNWAEREIATLIRDPLRDLLASCSFGADWCDFF